MFKITEITNKGTLRRGDVVTPRERYNQGGYMLGRVWKRIDDLFVVVIDVGQNVIVYYEFDLVLADYKGDWAFNRSPGNSDGQSPKWLPMPSLKRLKKLARDYNPFFGGSNFIGRRWTKEEKNNTPYRFNNT